jgi:hypothetical protein
MGFLRLLRRRSALLLGWIIFAAVLSAVVALALGQPKTATAPAPAVAQPSISPSASADPLSQFHAKVAVMLTCQDGKPNLRAWNLIDGMGDTSLAVTVGQPQAMGGVCSVLFESMNGSAYVRFSRPAVDADYHLNHQDWGGAWGPITPTPPYTGGSLNANIRGEAELALFDTKSMAKGPPLVPAINRRNEHIYTVPAGFPQPSPQPAKS